MFVLDEGGFNSSPPEVQSLSQFVNCLLSFVRVAELLFDGILKVLPMDTSHAVVIGTFILSLPVGGPGACRPLLHRSKNDTDLIEIVRDASVGNVTASTAPPDVESIKTTVIGVRFGNHCLSAGIGIGDSRRS